MLMPLDRCIFLSFAAESENVSSVFLSGWNGVDAFIKVFFKVSQVSRIELLSLIQDHVSKEEDLS